MKINTNVYDKECNIFKQFNLRKNIKNEYIAFLRFLKKDGFHPNPHQVENM